ncbi:DNA repair ATPase-like protein [Actinidia rufa]|uniref:DNA repair ATPase-like protein n=1 Tax=Actinidia rufa TaxID=165716 RepID=A0A7J0DX48_9ERIC|nr:DNA repair ATPase-like protein [Actinidia rufa]
MAMRPLLVLSIFLALILATKVSADASTAVNEHQHEEQAEEVVRSDGFDSSLKIELDQLKSHVLALESHVDEKTRELKNKDDILANKEKIIRETADIIASLKSEIASLQLQKIIEEQKTKIHKTERALQVAEEEMMKVKVEASSRRNELMEAGWRCFRPVDIGKADVHGAWLPPWLAAHLIRCQSFVETHWNMHGKPAFDEVIKKKWIPVAKEQWLVITTSMEPHVLLLSTKATEAYKASKSAVTPHVVKAQELVGPYFQEVKKVSKPYIDQVATVTKPHVDKVQSAIKPYTKEIVNAYGMFLESATIYHHQKPVPPYIQEIFILFFSRSSPSSGLYGKPVQDTVQGTLHKHELTRPLATKEFVWFAASALLGLPIFILSRICSAIFWSVT